MVKLKRIPSRHRYGMTAFICYAGMLWVSALKYYMPRHEPTWDLGAAQRQECNIGPVRGSAKGAKLFAAAYGSTEEAGWVTVASKAPCPIGAPKVDGKEYYSTFWCQVARPAPLITTFLPLEPSIRKNKIRADTQYWQTKIKYVEIL